MVAEGLTNNPVIIDNGSGIIKAGLAGQDQPKCIFPSIVGRPKHARVMAGAVEGDTFIGNRAQDLRGILSISYPMEHGIVQNWQDMERIWQHIYAEDLKLLSEEVGSHLELIEFSLFISLLTLNLVVCCLLASCSLYRSTSQSESKS